MLTEKITIYAPKYFVITNQKDSPGLILTCVSCLDPDWTKNIDMGETYLEVYQSISHVMELAARAIMSMGLDEPVWHPNFTGSEVKFFSQVYMPPRTTVTVS